MKQKTNHLAWVPSLYLEQGMHYTAIILLPIIAYKNLGISNAIIIIVTSFFTLPWTLKPLFSSWIESALTLRQWAYGTEIGIGLLFFILAMTLHVNHFFLLSTMCFLFIGTFAAWHDIACDGIYLYALDLKKQYSFMGIRNACYQCARLIIQGGIIALAGFLLIHHNAQTTWSFLFALLGSIIVMIGLYHFIFLPTHQTHRKQDANYFQHFINTTKRVIKAWLALPSAWLFAAFLFIYNACDAQLIRIAPMFFITKRSQGGLGFNNLQLSLNQVLGVIAFIVGSFIISYLLKRTHLAKAILWSYGLLALSNLGYIFLAFYPTLSITYANSIYFITQIMFGIANSTYMAYLMHLANTQKYRADFYTIASAMMSFSFMFFGFISAPMIHLLTFKSFFIWIVILGIMIFLFTSLFVKQGFKQ